MTNPAIIVALVVLPLIALYCRSKRSRGPVPPGPPGLPIIGNVRDIPTPQQLPWIKYHDWCQKYGTDVIRLHALGVNIIVLDSLESTTGLLDRRSSIYSDRPRMVMLNELAGFGWNFGSMDYGEDWRALRKMTHHEFHSGAFNKYRPVLLAHAHDFIRRLAGERGSRLPTHLKHMVGANILDVTYAIKVLPEDDPFITLAEAAQECVGRCATGGVYLVDILPILRYLPAWFPGAGFQREARVWHEAADRQLTVPYEDFMRRFRAGRAEDCMAKALIEAYGNGPATERHSKMAAATMYMGGAETIAASTHTFFLAMLLFPEVQARARREVEAVLGAHRLPTFNDIGSVPYLDALIREVLRWHPIVSLDLPRKLRTDDVYNGYVLEKDSLVIINIWAILHDEKLYPDPHTFKPERFLDKDGALDRAVLDPQDVAFGFGRRVCPGRYMAYDTMWITLATVLVCLNIAPAKDDEGREIPAQEELVSAFVSEPKPFPCDVRFRSEAHAALLHAL